jgi:hypothetical protein
MFKARFARLLGEGGEEEHWPRGATYFACRAFLKNAYSMRHYYANRAAK